MEHAIGEIITLPDGRKAEVMETKYNICDECMFNKVDCADIVGIYCLPIYRTDHKAIIYKEFKEK